MNRLAGKRAFITGAGSGIGRAAAGLFAEHGARVAVAELDRASGEAAVAEIEAAGGVACFLETDVTEPDSVEAAVATAVEAFGGLDILYNNAGGSTKRDGKVTELPIDEWWRTMKVDLFGTFLGCRFGIPALARSGGGSIINVTSIRGITGTAGANAYSAAKGGVATLTKTLALECAGDGIRVNAIAPGVIRTERVKRHLERGGTNAIAEKHLVGLGEPIDVALMALYLASDESRIVTGAIMPVDGGASAY